MISCDPIKFVRSCFSTVQNLSVFSLVREKPRSFSVNLHLLNIGPALHLLNFPPQLSHWSLPQCSPTSPSAPATLAFPPLLEHVPGLLLFKHPCICCCSAWDSPPNLLSAHSFICSDQVMGNMNGSCTKFCSSWGSSEERIHTCPEQREDGWWPGPF